MSKMIICFGYFIFIVLLFLFMFTVLSFRDLNMVLRSIERKKSPTRRIIY